MTDLILLGASCSIAFLLLGFGLGAWSMDAKSRYWRSRAEAADHAYDAMEEHYKGQLDELRREGAVRIIHPVPAKKRGRTRKE